MNGLGIVENDTETTASSPPSTDYTLDRPPISEIHNKWTSLFTNPHLTLSDLQQQTLSPHGLGTSGPEDELGSIALRSVFWRLFFSRLELTSLFSTGSRNYLTLSQQLAKRRRTYEDKRQKYLRAPDGRWANDCTSPENEQQQMVSLSSVDDNRASTGSSSSSSSVSWDPLSLGEENPWKEWFAQEELRETISKDVERTFPDIPYFRSPDIRRILTTILFLWSIEHPDIGYRQGMHELLAVILIVFDRDSLSSSPSSSSSPTTTTTTTTTTAMKGPIALSPQIGSFEDRSISSKEVDRIMILVLDRQYLQADVCDFFYTLMERASVWYEWKNVAVSGEADRKGVAKNAKIVEICERVQEVLLKKVDPVVYGKLNGEGIEGQLWGIRYIRLLFTRELPMPSALQLWDGLFALDPDLSTLVEGVALALILRIRGLILAGDYASILTNLLRYPGNSPQLPLSIPLIIEQANMIRKDPSASTGASIALQNQETLGIAPFVAARPVTPITTTRFGARLRKSQQQPASSGNNSSYNYGRFTTGLGLDGHITTPSSTSSSTPTGGTGYTFEIPGMARNLIARAQESGIDKAFLSKVSELRKNLPELAGGNNPSSFPFRTFTPPFGEGSAVSPSRGAVGDEEGESAYGSGRGRTLMDAEREIAELRLVMVGMGKAMAKWMATVEGVGEGEAGGESAREREGIPQEGDQTTAENKKETKQVAWAGLHRLCSGLTAGGYIPSSDLAREWAWSEHLESVRAPEPTMATAQMPTLMPLPASAARFSRTSLMTSPSVSGSASADLSAKPSEMDLRTSSPSLSAANAASRYHSHQNPPRDHHSPSPSTRSMRQGESSFGTPTRMNLKERLAAASRPTSPAGPASSSESAKTGMGIGMPAPKEINYSKLQQVPSPSPAEITHTLSLLSTSVDPLSGLLPTTTTTATSPRMPSSASSHSPLLAASPAPPSDPAGQHRPSVRNVETDPLMAVAVGHVGVRAKD